MILKISSIFNCLYFIENHFI